MSIIISYYRVFTVLFVIHTNIIKKDHGILGDRRGLQFTTIVDIQAGGIAGKT